MGIRQARKRRQRLYMAKRKERLAFLMTKMSYRKNIWPRV